jgi:hypothetical protein
MLLFLVQDAQAHFASLSLTLISFIIIRGGMGGSIAPEDDSGGEIRIFGLAAGGEGIGQIWI